MTLAPDLTACSNRRREPSTLILVSSASSGTALGMAAAQ